MRFEEKARALTWLADLSLTGLGELLLKPKRCIAPAAGAVIALPGASEKLIEFLTFPLGKLQNRARSSRLRIPRTMSSTMVGLGARLLSASQATTSAIVRSAIVAEAAAAEGPCRIGSAGARLLSGTRARANARLHLENKGKEARRKAVENASYLTALVVGMVGVTYASVPLYRMFCQATGYGGTTQRALTLEDKLKIEEEEPAEVAAAVAERELTVHFNADITSNMHWKFTPTQKKVRTTPGESTLAFYTVKNLSDKVS